tara:strand:- start:53 stop:265 length:213 start_codon:yes stop_codon:yes gene_type:complete
VQGICPFGAVPKRNGTLSYAIDISRSLAANLLRSILVSSHLGNGRRLLLFSLWLQADKEGDTIGHYARRN